MFSTGNEMALSDLQDIRRYLNSIGFSQEITQRYARTA